MQDFPKIISVDDHVLEPPDLWQARLPSSHRAEGPRVERRRMRKAGASVGWVEDPEGEWCDVWRYEDVSSPLMMLRHVEPLREAEPVGHGRL